MTLKDLPLGIKAQICSFENHMSDYKRLAEMGIVNGTEITPIFSSITKGLRAYGVNNTFVAVRDNIAENINVKISGGKYNES